MANPDALKAAFDAATSQNEWAAALVVRGLVLEFLALIFFSKEMSRKEKTLLAIGVKVGQRWGVCSQPRRQWAEATVIEVSAQGVMFRYSSKYNVGADETCRADLAVVLYAPRIFDT
jgi:hypothetical protein